MSLTGRLLNRRMRSLQPNAVISHILRTEMDTHGYYLYIPRKIFHPPGLNWVSFAFFIESIADEAAPICAKKPSR